MQSSILRSAMTSLDRAGNLEHRLVAVVVGSGANARLARGPWGRCSNTIEAALLTSPSVSTRGAQHRYCYFVTSCWNLYLRPARREHRHTSPAPCIRAMENLDKLSATGLPVFDLNSEHLEQKDWWDHPWPPRRGVAIRAPVLTNAQVSVTTGHPRQVVVCAAMPRQLLRAAHAPLRRYLLGGQPYRRAQPGLGKGSRRLGWPGHQQPRQLQRRGHGHAGQGAARTHR
jgi:hypothetical protein